VSVTNDGRMYFGVDPVSDSLGREGQGGSANPQDKKLYIKLTLEPPTPSVPFLDAFVERISAH